MSVFSRNDLQPALSFGGLGAVITIIGIYTFYALGAEVFADPFYGIVIFGLLLLINAGLAYGAGLMRKKANDGILAFKDAIGQTFITLGIVVIAYHAFYFLLLNVIDPGLFDQLTSLRIEKLKSLKEAGEMSKETYEQKLTITKNSQLTLLDTLGLTIVGLVMSFLLALILSAILRKEPEKN
jgi:hypothetical protein